ncbi:efflux RND transporter periplasmic adaptor subunit [Ensifer soli]|uniref:efflux RND transporter periplasmic adaptor subunit n=1 Tax=Ciceribacter sp. sgz301302 TaxID=3342379 RepID=UPI0035B730F3
MKRSRLVIGAMALSASAITAFAAISASTPAETVTVTDSRTADLLVRVTRALPVADAERKFTGTIAARVLSNLGFRVPGKIVERLVEVGQVVKAGQPLLRIDDTDLRLSLDARRNAVSAARAVLIQAAADERRYATLAKGGLAATPQRYEQAKAALDTAQAQFSMAEAQARVAENEEAYAVLLAGADGTIVSAAGEPGQVVAAGQTVVQLAHAGPREAVIALPETIRPVLGSAAEASLYGRNTHWSQARLRQISDAADPRSRTFEARYVLEGDAAEAPLGATVTVRISDAQKRRDVSVPIAAVLDDGRRTGVWALDEGATTVRFVPVTIRQLAGDAAIVTGVDPGQEIVALGAHRLADGASVRIDRQAGAAN